MRAFTLTKYYGRILIFGIYASLFYTTSATLMQFKYGSILMYITEWGGNFSKCTVIIKQCH